MKKHILFFTVLCSMTASIAFGKIETIFIDIKSVFHTNDMKASEYIGKFNALRYIAATGETPKEERLFEVLESIKAVSTQRTYNNNKKMPLILSDWLATMQPAQSIKNIVQKHLANRNIKDIEVKVLFAIVNMMLTPQNLADTQKANSKIEDVLTKLRQKNIKVYLVGNWAHTPSLKTKFGNIFGKLNGAFLSGDLHLLKPSVEFYQHVMEKTNVDPKTALWIESESQFTSKAKQIGLNVVSHAPNDSKDLIQNLKKFGINLD